MNVVGETVKMTCDRCGSFVVKTEPPFDFGGWMVFYDNICLCPTCADEYERKRSEVNAK